MSFSELRCPQVLVDALVRQGIREATPVQEQAIPAVRSGRDAIVQAQTGTGKTLAFLLPIVERIKGNAAVAQALVVSPTRELAMQTARVAKMLADAAGIRTTLIYGGQDIERQKDKLRQKPQLIIATPGRLLDHLRRHSVELSQVNKVVLDEADELMRLGFVEDVETMLEALAGDHQLMLFSATMPERIRALTRRYMKEPREITVQPERVTLDNIEQVIVDTREETKIDKLCELLNKYQPYLAMVFCHTKQKVAHVTLELSRRGYLVDELHGDLTQTQRNLVMRRFREAKLQILVVTDIAARGLDIEGVTHVFNYDLPQNTEWYIHRIGRTGRAGAKGLAVTFVNAHQYDQLRRIEAGIKARLAKQKSERLGVKKTGKKVQAVSSKPEEAASPRASSHAAPPPKRGKEAQRARRMAKKRAGRPAARSKAGAKTNAGRRSHLGKR